MFGRFFRWLTGRQSSPAAVVPPESLPPRMAVLDDEDDPYKAVILNECFRTGGMVSGSVTPSGDLVLRYQDGTTAVVLRDRILNPPPEAST